MKKVAEFKTGMPKTRNKVKGRHWSVFEKAKKQSELEAYFKIKEQVENGQFSSVHISFTFVFPDRKRRDLDNFFSTYEVKGIIDGVSRALGVDDCFYKTSMSISAVVESRKKELLVEVFASEVEEG